MKGWANLSDWGWVEHNGHASSTAANGLSPQNAYSPNPSNGLKYLTEPFFVVILTMISSP